MAEALIDQNASDPTLGHDSAAQQRQARQALTAAKTRFERLREENRNEEALAAALQVATLAQTAYGPGALENARPLIDLAFTQREAGDFLAAEQNYLAAIAIIERHENRLSETLIEPLIGLGRAYNRSGLNEQAVTHFNRAMRINHVNLGFYNFEQFKIQDGLTESYVGMRDFEEANFYQESQLEIYQRKLGAKNPEVVPAMYKLAEWYSRTGYLEESQLMYRGADRLLRENYGEKSTSRFDALLGLAKTYERQGNGLSAISTLKKAIRLFDENPESDPLQRAKLRVALGDLYAREAMPSAAETEYNAAWDDLSSEDIYREQRDKYFSAPVRVAGGPLSTYARGARNKSVDALQDGYVLISYTVSPNGRASDVKIVESYPTDVMDKSISTTYKRSYFRPRMEDGIAVEATGLLARHEFKYSPELDQASDRADESGSRQRSSGKRIESPD